MKNFDYTRKVNIYKNQMSDGSYNDFIDNHLTKGDFYENDIYESPTDGTSYDFLEEVLKAIKREKAKRAAITISTIAVITGIVIILVSYCRKKGG